MSNHDFQENPRILVLTVNPDAVCRSMRIAGASGEACITAADFFMALAADPWNGIALETRAYMRAGTKDRQTIETCTDCLPTMRFALSGGNIQVANDGGIRGFMEKAASTEARRMRVHGRNILHLPIAVKIGDRPAFMAVTGNLSRGGMFLPTCAALSPGEIIRVAFPGGHMGESSGFIRAEVRWTKKWSKNMKPSRDWNIPGVGLRFMDMTDEQRKCLEDMCSGDNCRLAEIREAKHTF